MQQHTDDGDACVIHASQNVKKMLDDRKIAGDDMPVDDVHECPGFLWGMKRGSEWAVLFMRDANKATVTAVMNFCHPPEDDEEHPHAGNDITHCIVAYQNKCTTTASKEMGKYKETHLECFKMDELARIPLLFGLCDDYTLLCGEEADRVRREVSDDKRAKIWTTDPVQRYFNAPLGSIFKTVERFGSLQPEIKYRVVTNPTS